jgi:hypothetical protein
MGAAMHQPGGYDDDRRKLFYRALTMRVAWGLPVDQAYLRTENGVETIRQDIEVTQEKLDREIEMFELTMMSLGCAKIILFTLIGAMIVLVALLVAGTGWWYIVVAGCGALVAGFIVLLRKLHANRLRWLKVKTTILRMQDPDAPPATAVRG